jgi:hypothetical protein
MTLPGRSVTIVVEPLELPAVRPEPATEPAPPAPAAPEPPPEREPAPA